MQPAAETSQLSFQRGWSLLSLSPTHTLTRRVTSGERWRLLWHVPLDRNLVVGLSPKNSFSISSVHPVGRVVYLEAHLYFIVAH